MYAASSTVKAVAAAAALASPLSDGWQLERNNSVRERDEEDGEEGEEEEEKGRNLRHLSHKVKSPFAIDRERQHRWMSLQREQVVCEGREENKSITVFGDVE